MHACAEVFGIRPHQDDGLCTLLYTDGQPGLEYAKCRVAGSMFFAESCRSDEQLSQRIELDQFLVFRVGPFVS